jgi:hypothetical protein
MYGEVIPVGVGGSRATEGKGFRWDGGMVVVVGRDGVSVSVEGVVALEREDQSFL